MHQPSPRIEGADAGAPGDAGGGAELAFLGLATIIGVVSWVAVILAEIGWLRPVALLSALPAALLALRFGVGLGLGGRRPAVRGIGRGRERSANGRGEGAQSEGAQGEGAQGEGARSEGARGADGRGATRGAGLRDGTDARGRRRCLAATLGCGLVLLVAAVAFLPPFESVLSASDATVYLAFGNKLAETGSLHFEDPFLAEIPIDARRVLFRNLVPGDTTGTHARFPGGFMIPEVTQPGVTAGFAPLYPVLLALAWMWIGGGAALYVGPLFALLSVAAVCLVGRRLAGGLAAGLLAGLLLAISLPQIWFARLGMAEVVAQFFIFAGLLALLASRETPRLAVVGGALFGMAVLAKFEMLVVLPVAVAGLTAIALASGSEALRRRVSLFTAPFFLLLLHQIIHLLAIPSHYGPFVISKLDRLGTTRLLGEAAVRSSALIGGLAVGGVAALAGLTLWALRPGRRPRRWAAGVVALIAAYAVAYAWVSRNLLAETLPWLGWYLSWPVVAAFFVAAVAALWRPPGGEGTAVLFLLALVAVSGFHHLYDPQEPIRHIWSVRRLVPIVLPGMLLIVATGLAVLAARLGRRIRSWLVAPIAVLLALLVARASLVIAGPPPFEGFVEATNRLADLVPTDAVLLVSSDLAGTHLATTLGYMCGRDAVLLRPRYGDPSMLEDIVLEWLGSGREVFLLLGDRPPHLNAPRLALSPVAAPTLEHRMLEVAATRRPQRMVESLLQLHLFRVGSSGGKRSVDIGSLADDIVFEMRGFHLPERDRARGTFRWTGPVATIELGGAGERIHLVVGGARPAGVPPARVSISVDGHAVVADLVVPDAPAPIVVENPQRENGGSTLTILSTVFSPAALGLSADPRSLGVRVYRIDY